MSERGKGECGEQETEEEEIRRLLLGIMEGYNDNVIPSLSYFSPFPGISIAEKGSSSRKREKDEISWVQSLIKERKRREQMSEKFSLLQSLVPTLVKTFKPPKEKIIGDTVNYIKYLKQETARLEGLKKSRCKEPTVAKPGLFKCTDENTSVKVAVSNGATFLAVQLPFRRGLVPEIVRVFEKHRAEVLEARICVNEQQLLTFTATIILASDGDSSIDKIRDEILTL
ncbi:transcription factor bHLH25-like [Sesamum indicum]|uniref:Transcription factor bHLH25-like n=1 Tax=Sesamum indicum TaxID=4182 RepID=A0A6I9TV15_SESIN|nr:transcription factor bHLH25-like [Sesamum indicum]